MDEVELAKLVRQHEAQKRAKRNHYHRHKEEINEKRRQKYADKKSAADPPSPQGEVVAEVGV